MCGIAGVATRGSTPPRELIGAMCNAMRHRGPDGEGIHVEPGVGLGMRRLAVLDLVTGDQPVTNESGTVRAVFNGEIYNYRELRAELTAKGHRFRGTGDSEVIPRLYEEHGLAFLSRLNGMFAIALWDSQSQRLLLARDRMGIKPLYYSVHGGSVWFASEVKCILAGGGTARAIDPLGVDQLLTFEYTASPTTLFEDVKKLPPGGWLTVGGGKVHQGRFWSLPTAEPGPVTDVRELAERVRTTLLTAVRRQLASDVPLGAFLSGGIDSSILVAAMKEVSPAPPLTFSIGFGDPTYSELRYARVVAEHCGTRHHEEILTPDYLSLLPEVISQLDQPIADFSVFPTLLVARMARRRVTVALGGDGGDELFGGYDTYRADRLSARLLDWQPARLRAAAEWLGRGLPLGKGKRGLANQLRRFLEGARLPSDWQHLRWMVFLRDEQRARLYTPGFRAQVTGATEGLVRAVLEDGGSDRLAAQMRCDLRLYLPEDILAKVDAMSMASSLEARVPYLDNEVVDLALSIPSSLKVRGGDRKWILKQAFAGALPAAVLERGKEGFSMPMKHWLAHEWNALMHELLSRHSLAAEGLFDGRYVDQLMREHETGAQNHSHLLWGLMVFQLWRDRFQAGIELPGVHVDAA
ncbi:MAG TPA: asparagine synthase (glutamine-hydrolyzing) [Steroidobacteraceae bacterium]|jgi:asparagine synthase (glutamine-hydrolysing)|nr:asparagine synthase (glutamine-hydrolyzing) [Steroidobacteraceae bacterium]